MPTYSANLLPDTTGRDLGNPSQKWDGYFQNVQVDTLTVFGSGSLANVTYSATPNFDLSVAPSQKMTLTGNVTNSTTSGATAGRLYTFSITQDGTGSRTFAWPVTFKGATTVDSTASTSTTQLFWYNGTNFIGFASAITL